ncbi:DUF2703 domain-containing protein [Anaeroarcus burkinensis]|uniref:DUF2703 domain-containing protein n=1 Tax=Anaeroarcus burkinensis TaxID=82376 RepID=UPI0003FB59ED|nr:DUF2703 domain-containing protein [Anaeroarcus burkinensis]
MKNSCDCHGDCCASEPERKQVVIDFLYLDLSVCQRCQGAEQNLEEALAEVAKVLSSAGYEVKVNRIHMATRALAIQYEFVSSPTIRVNGQDLVLAVTESACQDCGDLCGGSVACRSWVYEGSEYTEPPKAMIIAAILKRVFGGESALALVKEPYELPENLKVFFDGMEAASN